MTVSTCTDAWKRRISAYHDGGLVGAERAEVEAHVRDCPDCQATLASYDQLYRKLRALPGFEGMLTLTKPGTRRGLGSAARPTFTYPGNSAVGGSRSRRRIAGPPGGSIVIAAILVVVFAALLGRDVGVFRPTTAPPDGKITSTTGPIPTLGAQLPSGVVCANAASQAHTPYIYGDGQGQIWEVLGCDAPFALTHLPLADYQLGPVAPDALTYTALTPNNPTTRKLETFSPATGKVITVNLAVNGVTYTPDNIVWADTTLLFVQSGAHVLQVDTTNANPTSLLAISATQIAMRGNTLYYSTVNNGRASLHAYNIRTKKDAQIMDLGAGGQVCDTGGCIVWTTPWCISPDSAYIIYQTGPATLPQFTGNETGAVYLKSLTLASTTQFFTLPYQRHDQMTLAPDDSAIAIRETNAPNGAAPTQTVSLNGAVTATFTALPQLAWRPDGHALIEGPSHDNNQVRLYLISQQKFFDLPATATGYEWLPNG